MFSDYDGFQLDPLPSLPQPPPPPLKLTAYLAASSDREEVLTYIAENRPDLRCWIIANPHASTRLLERISQLGGPHVKDCFDLLFDFLGL